MKEANLKHQWRPPPHGPWGSEQPEPMGLVRGARSMPQPHAVTLSQRRGGQCDQDYDIYEGTKKDDAGLGSRVVKSCCVLVWGVT
jgi:hypothetical protein